MQFTFLSFSVVVLSVVASANHGYGGGYGVYAPPVVTTTTKPPCTTTKPPPCTSTTTTKPPCATPAPPPPPPPPPPPQAGQFYPVFFDYANYGTPAHFNDGAIGECRGTDGTVNVASIKMTSVAGGDPFQQPSNAQIKLVFYPMGGCAGNEIGIVLVDGQNPNVNLPSIPQSFRFYPYTTSDAEIRAQSATSDAAANGGAISLMALIAPLLALV